MEKNKSKDRNAVYRVFSAIEFTAVFAMAAAVVISGVANFI